MTAADPLRDATAALAGFLVAKATLGETLQWIAELALDAVSSADGVGLTLLQGRARPVTVFASERDLSYEVDQAQYAENAGPCLDAYRGRRVVKVDDARQAVSTWPGYARAASAAGVGSSLSLPLMAAEDVYGALNLYATTTNAFGAADVEDGQVFATHASVVLANASAFWDAQDLAHGLGEAMRTRAVIEMAKGKLMGSGRYTSEEAFQVLVNASQQSNTKLRDIAYRIVYGSDPPQTQP